MFGSRECQMSTNLSSMMTGLALLQQRSGSYTASGPSSFGTNFDQIESRKVRLAKALFTAPQATPPWRSTDQTSPSASSQVSQVKAMRSLIDKPSVSSKFGTDIEAAFTIWKALDRLKVLADAATRATMPASERSTLSERFANGLGELQTYMSTVPSNQLNFSFTQPARRLDTVAIERPALAGSATGRGVTSTRTGSIPALDPAATLRVALTKFGATQSFDLSIASVAQPPTLDGIATELNARLAGLTNIMGRFTVERADDKWHLAFAGPSTEAISFDEVGAADGLIVTTTDGTTATAGPMRLVRYDAPDTTMDRQLLGFISATDRQAMLASSAPTTPVAAAISVVASVTDAAGFTTTLGTTAGDVGSNIAEGGGQRDFLLTRLNSRGDVVWQRMLGAAGDTEGAGLALGAAGEVVVAATLAGGADGGLAGGDVSGTSDLLVARFDSSGEESFATVVARAGAQRAEAVAIAADGSILVGGSANSGADGVLARLDATGRVSEFQTLVGTGKVNSVAIAPSGNLLALVQNGTSSSLQQFNAQSLATPASASLSLGAVAATKLAVSSTGRIAVGGSNIAGPAGGRDAFVELVAADLSGGVRTNIGTAGTEWLDSLAFATNGETLHVGGRTSGTLGTQKTGTVDGFIARLDAAAGGAVTNITQFGQFGRETGAVGLSYASGGAAKLPEALGFHRGTINSQGLSPTLIAATRLRAGDQFQIKVGVGALRTVTVAADDTLASFATKVRSAAGSRATVTTPYADTSSGKPGQVLRIQSVEGYPIQISAGPEGRDALAALGLKPGRIFTPLSRSASAPSVTPGGQFGLALNDSLTLGSSDAAKFSLSQIKSALSMTESGYRSLYWDDAKARLVDGGNGLQLSAAQSARLEQYRRAIDRLSSISSAGFGF